MHNDRNMVDEALASEYVVLSVMGPHAGEDESTIFARKMKEIEDEGFSLWVHSSNIARPEAVKRLCHKVVDMNAVPYCIFIEGGSEPTKEDRRASEYSGDKIHWHIVPQGINPTGNIGNSRTVALVFDGLWVIEKNMVLDLWDYSVFESPGRCLKTARGSSTVCAEKTSSIQDEKKMKSHVRRVTAIGSFVKPYSAWLR